MIVLMRSKYAYRRKILAIQYFSGGILVLAMAFTEGYSKLAIGLFGYLVICGSFSTIFLYTNELLPTVIRGKGFGVLNAIGQIGSIVGMQILKLEKIKIGFIFSGICMSGAASVLMLSETFKRPLLQTLDEAELFF